MHHAGPRVHTRRCGSGDLAGFGERDVATGVALAGQQGEAAIGGDGKAGGRLIERGEEGVTKAAQDPSKLLFF